ncbi:MAG TPA: type II toxin-antitoxin system RelE/ParE family toxin [Rubricoccaceae bacterium]|jgi:mRNA-degrading endonuclease RelE of RelBE toxin-antitoxin system|nr:type II toxin-antitoxin system RelE/ParE family toxin [Rubricoccaceae bacterium]
MPSDSGRHPVEVLFTSEFKRNLRHLARRYRSIRRDVEPLIERLASGETPGDRVRQTGHVVYKVRVPNSDARRGKSGGYRVIYYVQTSERVILITIYSKSEQGDVSPKLLREIIEEQAPPSGQPE